MRRHSLTIALMFVVSLICASGAQAVVVDMNASGPLPSSPSPYNPFDQSGYYGVRPVPGTSSDFANAGIATVASSGACVDPALSPDLVLQSNALCWHGGPVIHKNETFAFVWDPNPNRNFAAGYEEQFLRDVADGSGTFTSPFAETSQYTDTGGRAANASLFGGGFDDGASAYPTDPAESCPESDGVATYANEHCVTDAAIRSELSKMVQSNGIVGRLKPGYSPLLVVLMPPGVETCIDSVAHLCSANSSPSGPSGMSVTPVRFCSYHSQFVGPGGITFPYVVQPFTARTDDGSGTGADCDEPDVPKIPPAPTSAELAQDLGARLVSPLSEAHIASIINPNLNGWFGHDGSESSDNGCTPASNKVDTATVGNSSQNPYYLQRDFNNAGGIVHDPFAMECVGGIVLNPRFVVPSAVNQGDVVQFDGQATQSTLLVPNANFTWDFGDGTIVTGPSQTHVYTKGGTYSVKLTVTDRGGDTATLSQSIVVLDKNGQVVVPGGSGSSGSGASPVQTPLRVRMRLLPQSLRLMLRSGLSIVVTSNQPANAIVTLSIPRSAAKRAHIRAGNGPSVLIGRGTASKIASGTGSLRLRLAASTVKKLRRLRHVTVTVRLALVAAGNSRTAVVAAARY